MPGNKPKIRVEVPSKWPPIQRPRSHHPIGMSEGLMEKLIKRAAKGGNFISDDDVYLEQYLHPEHDIIPKQSLRPTRLSRMPNMEFRHVPNNEYGAANVTGLGKYIDTLGKDYRSIYDTWDFDTDVPLFADRPASFLNNLKEWTAKKFMQHAGTPFAVYERYPRAPEGRREPFVPGTSQPKELFIPKHGKIDKPLNSKSDPEFDSILFNKKKK